MACKITANVSRDCAYGVAGIKALYLANLSDITTFATDTAGLVSAITMADTAKFYKFEALDDTVSAEDALTVSNNNKYRTQTINFKLDGNLVADGKLTDLINNLNGLSLGKFVAAVVDKNGNTMIYGSTNGLTATSANFASGGASGDARGWTYVLTGVEPKEFLLCTNESVVSAVAQATDTIVP
jgi:hypothetical protein